MRCTYVYFCSALWLTCAIGQAQEPPKQVPADTVQTRYLLLSADLLAPVHSMFSGSSREASIDISAYLRRWYLSISTGIAEKSPEENNYRYRSSGYFLRISPGMSFRILGNPQIFFHLGAGYGISFFEEELSITQYSSLLEEHITHTARQNLHAGWLEAHSGFRIQLHKRLHLGYTVRYMFNLQGYQEETFDAYYVPGYRKDNRNSKFLLHYYLSYMFSWRPKNRKP